MSEVMMGEQHFNWNDGATPDRGQSPLGVESRLMERNVESGDRTLSVLMHLWPFFFAFVPGLGVFAIGLPLIGWLVRKDRSRFVDDHGREIMNVVITWIIILLSCVLVITIPFVLVWAVFQIVCAVIGAIAAGRSEYYRYPMIIRILG